MKSTISIGIAATIALMLILIIPIGIINQVTAEYPVGVTHVTLTIGSSSTVLSNGKYNGPTNSMTQASNGQYLAFVREGNSSDSQFDYGIMKLYNSTDGSTWTYNQTLLNVTNRDVRNYAAGTTQTGKIFVFYQTYDCFNLTWNNTFPQYISSTDNGTTWSGAQSMSCPMIDGFLPTDGCPHGEVKQLGPVRIGLTIYTGNGSGTHLRFAYSDDDGVTWSQVNISTYYSLTPDARIITEADIAYLGNDRLVAMSRIDGLHGQNAMFTSIDNGLTWSYRGLWTGICQPAMMLYNYPVSLTAYTDSIGEIWVLAVFAYYSVYYTYGYGTDVMNNGVAGWSSLTNWSSSLQGGLYPTGVFDTSGNGIMIMSHYIDVDEASLVAIDLTVTGHYPTAAQRTLMGLIDIIGLFFVIGVVGAIVIAAIEPLRNEKKKMTIDHLIQIFIFVIIGMAMIGVYYSMFT